MQYDPADPKYDDLVWALGNLTVWFNMLESHVLAETWHVVTRGPDMGHLVTDRMSFARVVDLLVAAYLLLAPDRKADVERLRTDLVAANKKRNTFVHGIWAPDRDPKQVVKGSRVAKYQSGWVGPDVESRHDLAATIAEVHKTIMEIRHLSGRVVDVRKLLPVPGPPLPPPAA